MPDFIITGRQLSAARALLGLHQAHVAEDTACTRTSVSKVEHDIDLPVKGRIIALLKARGVEFIRGGVRLKVSS